LGSFN